MNPVVCCHKGTVFIQKIFFPLSPFYDNNSRIESDACWTFDEEYMPPIDGTFAVQNLLSFSLGSVGSTADAFTRLVQLAPDLGMMAEDVSLVGIQGRVADLFRSHSGFEMLSELHRPILIRLASNETVHVDEALPALEALAAGLASGAIRPDPGYSAGLSTVLTTAAVTMPMARYFTTDQVSRSQKIARRLLGARTIDEAMQVVTDEYPEMKWLTGQVNATPERGDGSSTAGFVSERLFQGNKHVEFDRTALGIMTFLWVLKGDYKSFTACQPEKARLKEGSFMELQSYTRRILQSAPEAFDSLIVYMLAFDALTTYTVVNDMGKVVSMVDFLVKQAGMDSVDHDKILYDLLSIHPQVSPSFNRLPDRYKTLILNGLKAVFNMGQFMQAENVPASLTGLIGLDKASLDFYLLHFVYDLAGAAGQVRQDGSVVLTEDNFQAFKAASAALDGLNKGDSLETVYNNYLKIRAERLGLDIGNPTESAVTRACCMFRIFNRPEASEVLEVFRSLPENIRLILERELVRNGTSDGWAILPYYGPAFLTNLRTAYAKMQNPEPLKTAARTGLETLARVFQLGRIALRKREGNGVYIINLADVAKAALSAPSNLVTNEILLHSVGSDATAGVSVRSVIESARFEKLSSLSDLPGRRIAVIGIGGGSDAIQASMLGKLLRKAGKDVPAVISVRTDKTASQGLSGRQGEKRTISPHGGEIATSVFRVIPESRGSGRFLEYLPAADFQTFLAIDFEDDSLAERIQGTLDQLGGIDTVIALDTGGDALYSVTGQDQAHATPDQDLRVLNALRRIKARVLTAEVAPGVDSPENAQSILLDAGARTYELPAPDRDLVLSTYQAWDMTGRNEERYGKTALAWQKALRGNLGIQCLDLPARVVLDEKNPWNPFVHVDVSTAHVFFMDLERHLKVIGS